MTAIFLLFSMDIGERKVASGLAMPVLSVLVRRETTPSYGNKWLLRVLRVSPGRPGVWPRPAWNCVCDYEHVSSCLWALGSADRGGGWGWEKETQSNERP